MNLIPRRRNINFNLLKWRKRNLQLILDEYIPFIVDKLNTDVVQVVGYKLAPVTRQYEFAGFAPENLLELSVTLQPKIEDSKPHTSHVLVPIPNKQDFFSMGGSTYIMVNVLMDEPYLIFRGEIRSTHFIVSNGMVYYDSYKQSLRGNKQRVKTPLYKLIAAFDLFPRYFKNARFVEEKDIPPNHEVNGKVITRIGSIYFISDDYIKNLRPVQKLILNSLRRATKKSDVILTDNKKAEFVIKFGLLPIPLRNMFTSGYTNTIDIFIDALDEYDKYSHLEDVHLRFKRLKYAEIPIEALQEEISRFNKLSEKDLAKGKQVSLATNRLVKAAKQSRFIQWVDLNNPIQEIAMRNKITAEAPRVGLYVRNVSKYQVPHICPLDTPDSEKVGMNMYATPEIEVNEYGQFITSEPPIVRRSKIGDELIKWAREITS